MKLSRRIVHGLLLVFLLVTSLFAGNQPALAQSPDDLNADLEKAISQTLAEQFPKTQLNNLIFKDRVLTLDLALPSTDEAFVADVFDAINLTVNAVFDQHKLSEDRTIEYELLVDGKPLYPNDVPQVPELDSPMMVGKKVVVSPGHGWYDTGSGWSLQRSYYSGIVEDFINSNLVAELNTQLAGYGASIYPTRQLNKFVGNHTSGYPWWQMDASEYVRSLGAPYSVWNAGYNGTSRDIVSRPEYANWIGANMLVSIHNNGGGGCGTETLYDTSNGYATQSQRLATLIQNKLIERLRAEWNANWCNRGAKGSNGSYGENRRFNGPAVIVELGFMDNTSDNAALRDPRFRTIAMTAVRDAMVEFYAGTTPSAPTGLIEGPVPGTYQNTTITMKGYAQVLNSSIARVEVWINDLKYTNATYPVTRSDGKPGWQWTLNTVDFGNAVYTIKVKAVAANGKETWLNYQTSSSIQYTVSNLAYPSCLKPLYRYVNIYTKRHYYTTSWALSVGNTAGWKHEGTLGFVTNTATCFVANGAPLYRLWNSARQKYIYTAKASEKDTLLTQGYVLQATEGYVSPVQNEAALTLPVYRLYKAGDVGQFDDHFYSVNVEEVNNALASGYTNDGVVFYVFNLINKAPNKPTLVSPASNASLTSLSVNLTWSDAGDPDNYPRTYRSFQAKIRKDGSTWTSTRAWSTTASWSVTLPSTGKYCWTAQSSDGASLSGWQTERCFTVAN